MKLMWDSLLEGCFVKLSVIGFLDKIMLKCLCQRSNMVVAYETYQHAFDEEEFKFDQ